MTNIQQVCHYIVYWSIEELLTLLFYDKHKPHVHNDMEVVNTSLYTQLYTYTKWQCFLISLHKRHTWQQGSIANFVSNCIQYIQTMLY